MVLRFEDNRLSGLLRDLEEAISDAEDPTTLRRLGVQLKLLADKSRGKAFDLHPKHSNRTW